MQRPSGWNTKKCSFEGSISFKCTLLVPTRASHYESSVQSMKYVAFTKPYGQCIEEWMDDHPCLPLFPCSPVPLSALGESAKSTYEVWLGLRGANLILRKIVR